MSFSSFSADKDRLKSSEYTADLLSLIRKNEESQFRILTLESEINSAKAELKKMENWNLRYQEQKKLIQKLHEANEDLRQRLEISLNNNNESYRKYQEEISNLNHVHMLEISQIKDEFKAKEKEHHNEILKLKLKKKKLKMDLNNAKSNLDTNLSNIQKDLSSTKYQTFSLGQSNISLNNSNIEMNDSKIRKLRKMLKVEKMKKEKIKTSFLKQKVTIDEKNKTIDKLRSKIDKKQETINALQTEISIQSQNSLTQERSDLLPNFSEINPPNTVYETIDKLKNENESLKLEVEQLSKIRDKYKEEKQKTHDLKISLKDSNKEKEVINDVQRDILNQNQKLAMKLRKKFESDEGHSQVIDYLNSVIKILRKEMIKIVKQKENLIPYDKLPINLITNVPNKNLTINDVVNWYNSTIELMAKEIKNYHILQKGLQKFMPQANLDFENLDIRENMKRIIDYKKKQDVI